MEGCFSAQKKDGSLYYRASVTYRAKHISLGSFSVRENAVNAYREAGRLLSDVSLSLSDYTDECFLSFENGWCLSISGTTASIFHSHLRASPLLLLLPF